MTTAPAQRVAAPPAVQMPGSFVRRHRAVTAAAILLASVGVLLPVHTAAVRLVGTESIVLPDVMVGVWIFKLLLVLNAALMIALDSVRLRTARVTPLMDFSLPSAKESGPHGWLLGGILLVAIAVRLVQLDHGLWFDEIRTLVEYGRLSFGQIIATYESQNQHLLYSLLARGFLRVFGEGSFALRLPAVLFGVASLGAIYWFGARVAARREALLATALLSVSYHHVWFSQNARGYTALLLWTMLGSGLLLELLSARTPRMRTTIAYAAVMALAVFTHITAALVVIAHALIWLALVSRRSRRGRAAEAWPPMLAFVLATSLSLQLYALVFPQFMQTLLTPAMGGVATEWKSPLWLVLETTRGLAMGVPGGLVSIGVAALVGVTGVVAYARKDRITTAVMLLPGALTAAAVLATNHNLWPRFFFFCAGFAVLIVVRGVFTLMSVVAGSHGAKFATGLLVTIMAGSAMTMPRAWAAKQDFAGAQAWIETSRNASDAVVTVDLSSYPFEEYLNAGWLAATSETELRAIERAHPRTWVVYTFPTRLAAMQPGIWQHLERHYSVAATFPGTVGGGDIIVKVSP